LKPSSAATFSSTVPLAGVAVKQMQDEFYTKDLNLGGSLNMK